MSHAEPDRRSAPLLIAPLVGRDLELATLHRHVAQLPAGTGGAILIEGEAGTGKTRLVEAILLQAQQAGVATAHAGSDPLGTRRPFHLALSLAAELGLEREHGDSLGHLLASVGTHSEPVALIAPGSARVAVIDAIITELETIAGAPLIVAVEDLHWADDASLATLRAVLPLTRELPLLVVATSRPGGGTGIVHDQVAELGTVVSIGELEPAQTSELAAQLLGASIGPALDVLLRRTGGNPFLVTELLRVLSDRGHLHRGGDQVDIAGSAIDVEDALVDTVASRIRSLPDTVRQLLRPASVLAGPFSLSDVAAVAGVAAASLADAIDRALDIGILVAESSRLRFQHELVRDAVYQGMAASVRAALHQEAARVLAAGGASPVVVAAHATLGAAPDEAVGWLQAAAANVMNLAPEAALSMLDEALGLGIDDDAVRAAVQRARVESLMGVGRLEDAALLAEQILPTYVAGDERANLRIRLAGILVLLNRTGEAVAHLERAAAEAGSSEQRALALAQQALSLMTMSDVDAAARVAREAAALAEASGERSARTIAASVLGRLPCFTHGYEAGLPAAMTAVEGADVDATGRAHDYVPWFWAGVIALDLDDHELVERAVQEGRRRADERYASWAQPLYCGLAASLHFRRGNLDECRAEAGSGISLSVDTGSSQAKMWCESLAALAAHFEGDDEARDELVAAADRTWSEANALLGIDHFALAQALSLESAPACDHLGGAWDLFDLMASRNCQPLLAVPLARVAVYNDERRLRAVVDTVADAAQRTSLDGFAALELHVRGIEASSIDMALQGAQLFAGLSRPLDEAEALADAARWAHREGDERARSLLDRARGAFEACGAYGSAARLAAELDDAAEPRTATREAWGWNGLTATERAIAALVGAAMTNGEIAEVRCVSRRTVESHLRRIYMKLGYSSRTRLALEATQHLTPPAP